MTTFFSYKKQPSYSRLKWKWWTKGGFVSYCNYTGNLPTAVICPRLCHAEPGFPSTHGEPEDSAPQVILSSCLVHSCCGHWRCWCPCQHHHMPMCVLQDRGTSALSSVRALMDAGLCTCPVKFQLLDKTTLLLPKAVDFFFFLIILHLYHSKNYLNHQVDSLQILFSVHWLPTFLFDQTEILMQFSS